MGTLSLKKAAPSPSNGSAVSAEREARRLLNALIYQERLQVMSQWRPDLFNPSSPVPLKIGIHRDLLKLDRNQLPLSKTQIKKFLRVWCKRTAYRASLLNGHTRHGL